MTANEFFNNQNVQNLLQNFPLFLTYGDEKHILVFRRLLERSLKYGYWNGRMAAES